MELNEVVRKLVGEIRPVGETETDAIRLENIKVMTGLVADLLAEIAFVAGFRDRNEASMKKIGQYAANFLADDVRDYSEL